MNLTMRVQRLEQQGVSDYKPSPVPELEPLNRAVYNLKRQGISLADVLEAMSNGYA